MPGSLVSTRSSRLRCCGGAVGYDHLPGVDAVADADTAAVMNADPRCAVDRIDQGVEQRPVGDGVGPVQHAFRLAVGAGHRAAVEMVAADDDRRLDHAACHQFVEDAARRAPAPHTLTSRCGPAALGTAHAAAPVSANAPGVCPRGRVRAWRHRWRKCRRGRRRAPPSGTGLSPSQNSGRM